MEVAAEAQSAVTLPHGKFDHGKCPSGVLSGDVIFYW